MEFTAIAASGVQATQNVRPENTKEKLAALVERAVPKVDQDTERRVPTGDSSVPPAVYDSHGRIVSGPGNAGVDYKA